MSTTDSYLEVGDADDLASELTELSAWASATLDAKTAALRQASIDVDAAMPYQGRQYDAAAQSRQFPRMAEDADGGVASSSVAPPGAGGVAGAGVVWDWDDAISSAIVPDQVKLAVLYQADSILAGTREARINAEHDGVVYQLTGTLAESYKLTPGPGVPTGLCRRAWILMRKYRLRSGRLL